MRNLRAVTLVALTLAVVGCAAPRPLLTPMAPETLGAVVEVRQQITARFGGDTRTMQVALKVAPNDLTLIGLTAVGQRLFTLSWNGRHAELVSSVDQLEDMDPARILADLQLAYWPLPALRAALPDGLRLEQYGTARVLWRDSELLWVASSQTTERWTSTITLYNARIGYRLTIRPLALGARPIDDQRPPTRIVSP